MGVFQCKHKTESRGRTRTVNSELRRHTRPKFVVGRRNNVQYNLGLERLVLSKKKERVAGTRHGLLSRMSCNRFLFIRMRGFGLTIS
jgi:hypothetical protein